MSKEHINTESSKVIGLHFDHSLPFISWTWFTAGFSSLIIVVGIVGFIMKGGFNLGIDFKGGVKVEVQVKNKPNVEIKDIRKIFSDAHLEAEVNTVGVPAEKNYMITTPIPQEGSTEEITKVVSLLTASLGQDNVELRGSELVESKIGKAFAGRALQLLLIVSVMITIYVLFRFDIFYSIGAIGAVMHDVLIMLAFAVFFNIPIDVTIIAAILTIIGYSINDDIVVFDRIRELKHMHPEEDFEVLINKGVTQTLSRTIITVLTVFFVASAMYFFGGIVLKNFAFLLMVGLFFGCYSSIFVASPITLFLRRNFGPDKKKKSATVA